MSDISNDLRPMERRWQAFWAESGIHRFDPESSAPTFSVDTPPPTVSGDLHIGHVFSYTQAEIVARYMRMRGFNVFYPFGFDDNGLPTERLVERELGARAASMPRRDFVEACLEVSARYEARFEALWKGLGFSVEWTRLYSTIDERSRRVSQRSFLDLYRKGLVYRRAEPAPWCPQCRCSVAQAEAEDREAESRYLRLRFALPDGGFLPVDTTRPELLPALAAVFVHPDDPRYAGLVGGTCRAPYFGLEAPILADPAADPAKGTGAVMCCAYGDSQDVAWFRERGFEPRLLLGPDGRLGEAAGVFAGLPAKEARERLSALLVERGLAEPGPATLRPVNVHERCGTELEFRSPLQWFIRVKDRKEDLERIGREIEWRPAYMRERYLDWVRNLKWDWCVSRQRRFGLPFPLWHCAACGKVKLAEEAELPVDPATDRPSSPCPCGSNDFLPETDVMDTWATSSVSPEINSGWGEPGDLSSRIAPFSLRPQAHDIIRTWAFYTIVKSLYHHGRAPWREIMVSGHSRDPRGNKISKSKGNAGASPEELAELHGADPIRYWAASAKLGTDSAFSEKTVGDGRKLVLKILNAAAFAKPFVAAAPRRSRDAGAPEAARRAAPLEAWIAASFRRAASACGAALERRDYDEALATAETFFRRALCDEYLESCKPFLLRSGEAASLAEGPEAEAAAACLAEVLYGALRLLAPYLPHATEEAYQRLLAGAGMPASIHVAPWPEDRPLPGDAAAIELGDAILECVGAARGAKTAAKLSLAAPLTELRLRLDPSRLPEGFAQAFEASSPRLRAMLRLGSWRLEPGGPEPEPRVSAVLGA